MKYSVAKGLHILHLNLGPNHRSMYSLNFLYDVSDLIFSGSAFQIFVLSLIKLLSPQVVELKLLTTMLLRGILAFSFDENMSCMKLGLKLS